MPGFKIRLGTPIVSFMSLSRIQKFMFKESFIVGHEFEVNYTITNIGDDVFPGGSLVISIDWPNGQREITPYEIPRLKPENDHTLGPSRWGILSSGFALFYAYLIVPGQREKTGVDIVSLFRDDINEIKNDVCFFSLFGQTREEFYQYWAMIFAVLGVWILILEKLLQLFTKWRIPISEWLLKIFEVFSH